MDKPPFKKIEIADVFTPECKAVFERPRENSDIVKIELRSETGFLVGDFHCNAAVLRTAAEMLHCNPINSQPSTINPS